MGLSSGQRAYMAYGEKVGGKNYQGLPMPAWENLTPLIRDAWEAAVNEASIVEPIPDPVWFQHFDERQRNQIRFSRLYASQFGHGADGHNNMLIISQMASLLDTAESERADAPTE